MTFNFTLIEFLQIFFLTNPLSLLVGLLLFALLINRYVKDKFNFIYLLLTPVCLLLLTYFPLFHYRTTKENNEFKEKRAQFYQDIGFTTYRYTEPASLSGSRVYGFFGSEKYTEEKYTDNDIKFNVKQYSVDRYSGVDFREFDKCELSLYDTESPEYSCQEVGLNALGYPIFALTSVDSNDGYLHVASQTQDSIIDIDISGIQGSEVSSLSNEKVLNILYTLEPVDSSYLDR